MVRHFYCFIVFARLLLKLNKIMHGYWKKLADKTMVTAQSTRLYTAVSATHRSSSTDLYK
jgi:hypothetical protein